MKRPRSCVVPLLMFVMRKAGAFLAAGLREGHCGGAPPPLLPPYMLALLFNTQICALQLAYPQRWVLRQTGACYRLSCVMSASAQS